VATHGVVFGPSTVRQLKSHTTSIHFAQNAPGVAPRLKRFHQLGQVRAELLRPEEDKELSDAALIAAADNLDRRGQLGQ